MAEFWRWQGDEVAGVGYVLAKDKAGRQGLNSIFGEQITGNRIANIAIQFQYNLATNDVTATTEDTSTATQSNHQAVVSTGSAATASATLQSVKSVRYIPGYDGYAYFTTEFSEPIAGANQYIGPFNSDNGFFIGFTGTAFGITKRKNGVDTTIEQDDFNLNKLDGSGAEQLNINFSFMNIWRITYGWLGTAPIVFEAMSQNGDWIPFHIIRQPNSQTGTSIGNPVLPMKMQVAKTSGTADITLKTGSWNAGVVGSGNIGHSSNRFKSFSNDVSITATSTLTNIFTLRSVSAFQTFTNRVMTKIHFISAACDGNKITSVRVIKNANFASITASFTAVDAVNSVIEYDTTASTISSGETLMTVQLGKTDSKTIDDVEHLVLAILPTETLTFAAISTNATDVSISTRWAEEF